MSNQVSPPTAPARPAVDKSTKAGRGFRRLVELTGPPSRTQASLHPRQEYVGRVVSFLEAARKICIR